MHAPPASSGGSIKRIYWTTPRSRVFRAWSKRFAQWLFSSDHITIRMASTMMASTSASCRLAPAVSFFCCFYLALQIAPAGDHGHAQRTCIPRSHDGASRRHRLIICSASPRRDLALHSRTVGGDELNCHLRRLSPKLQTCNTAVLIVGSQWGWASDGWLLKMNAADRRRLLER